MHFLTKQNRSLLIIGVALLSFCCFFLGVKCGVIFHFGSAIPFWDQWDAEAMNLYKPFLEGTLTLDQLLAPHNEHRIFTTRLLALLLLKVNGLWNPLFQMVANAFFHLVALLITLAVLVYTLGKKTFFPFLLLLALFFSIPFGWENTLAGFQSQFYFVLIFSLPALFLLIEKEPFSWLWWTGIFFGVVSFFSLASGVFALAAGVIVLGVQYLLGINRSLRCAVALLLLGSLVLLGIKMTPTILGHAPLKAHSIRQFLESLMIIMSWPLPGQIGWFLVRNIPVLLFCGNFLLQPRSCHDRRWILLGLVIWSSIQIMSIAYGRSMGCMAPRYTDFFAVSVLINFACFFDGISWKPGKIKVLALATWTVIIFYGLFSWFYKVGLHQLEEKK
ncbi:MAG: hypothetical protein K2W99_04855 [Chthoniobacterales bacterium]|nr:hypothetical protein [Chthoniobacterales bacterium]